MGAGKRLNQLDSVVVYVPQIRLPSSVPGRGLNRPREPHNGWRGGATAMPKLLHPPSGVVQLQYIAPTRLEL